MKIADTGDPHGLQGGLCSIYRACSSQGVTKDDRHHQYKQNKPEKNIE